MHLLHTQTMELEQFHGTSIPDYAILSHVWEEEEVSFQDWADMDKARGMKGFLKISAACEIAWNNSWEYIWIDTCCINKESSTELSEAINSMFSWYKNSQICYTYLHDVPSNEDPKPLHSAFAMSRWFSRGWTLQELLAPRWVTFYGADWVNIGSKGSLQHTISSITGIPANILVNKVPPDMMSVAVRMSWAADRFTTRVEDIAYCLMGIFRVNMPLLYGEGQQAFLRLQREIMGKNTDHSVFAWRAGSEASSQENSGGILAMSPAAFRHSDDIISSKNSDAYFVTNKGLNFQSVIFFTAEPDVFLLPLDCTLNSKRIAIFIRVLEQDQYIRTCLGRFGDGSPEVNQIAKPIGPLFVHTTSVDEHEQKQTYAAGSSVSVMVILSDDYGDVIFEAHPRLEPYEVSDWDLGRKAWFPEFWKFGHGDEKEDLVDQRRTLLVYNADRMDRFAVVFPLSGAYSGSIGTDIVLAESPSETAQAIDKSYTQGKRAGLAQDADKSSISLPSGWSVFVSVSKARANKARDWDLFRVQIQVKRSNPQLRRIPWTRPEGQCVWVTLPALHHGFDVVGPVDEPSARDSRVYWSRHEDSFVFCTAESTVGNAPLSLPQAVVRKTLFGLARLNQVFFGTQSESAEEYLNGTLEFKVNLEGKILTLRLMIVLRREAFPPFELKVSTFIHGLQERFGSEEPGTYSVRLEDGRPLLLVTVRNSRVISVADFLVSITMGDIWGKASTKGIPWEEGEEVVLPNSQGEGLGGEGTHFAQNKMDAESNAPEEGDFSGAEDYWKRDDSLEDEDEGSEDDEESLDDEDVSYANTEDEERGDLSDEEAAERHANNEVLVEEGLSHDADFPGDHPFLKGEEDVHDGLSERKEDDSPEKGEVLMEEGLYYGVGCLENQVPSNSKEEVQDDFSAWKECEDEGEGESEGHTKYGAFIDGGISYGADLSVDEPSSKTREKVQDGFWEKKDSDGFVEDSVVSETGSNYDTERSDSPEVQVGTKMVEPADFRFPGNQVEACSEEQAENEEGDSGLKYPLIRGHRSSGTQEPEC